MIGDGYAVPLAVHFIISKKKQKGEIMSTKTIFITGGSRGIGRAVVEASAGKYNVAFTYNNSENEARALEKELNEKYDGVLAIKCDVADEKSVNDAVEIAKKRFGKIDILINNAGIAKSGLLIDTSLEEFRHIFDVNVMGTFLVTKAVLVDMLSREQGSIVNLSSVWGINGASMEVAYSASKSAVIGFTKALAKEVAPSGVRVNAVAPGAIDTDMMSVYSDEEKQELCQNSIPLGRLGTPKEVADAILFVANNEYMTGSVLDISALLG